MARWFYGRQICEEPLAADAADQYSAKLDRFEEAYDALKWLLARRADSLNTATAKIEEVEYHLYRQGSDPLAKTPAIVVVYTLDDHTVTILAIRAEKAKSSDPE